MAPVINWNSRHRGFSTPNASFEEFRYGASNSVANSKANGHSGRRFLDKVRLIVGVRASDERYEMNNGSFGAEHPDGKAAHSLGFGYTAHHQNDSVPVGSSSMADKAAMAHSLQFPSWIDHVFAISQAGSDCATYHNYAGQQNVGFDRFLSDGYVKDHAS